MRERERERDRETGVCVCVCVCVRGGGGTAESGERREKRQSEGVSCASVDDHNSPTASQDSKTWKKSCIKAWQLLGGGTKSRTTAEAAASHCFRENESRR